MTGIDFQVDRSVPLCAMRRLRYIPGLFSLALLLPCSLWYLNAHRVFKQERCFNMVFLPDKPNRMDLEHYSEWYDLHATFASSSTPDFRCGNGSDASIEALRGFRQRMHELAAAQDTSTWVHVRFDPDAKYATIMDAVETCRMTTDIRSLVGHDLVTRFYRKAPTFQPEVQTMEFEFICGGVISEPPSRMDKAVDMSIGFIERIRPVWPAIPIFIVLVIIGLVRGVKGAGPYFH